MKRLMITMRTFFVVVIVAIFLLSFLIPFVKADRGKDYIINPDGTGMFHIDVSQFQNIYNGTDYIPVNTNIWIDNCTLDYCVRDGYYDADFSQSSNGNDAIIFSHNGYEIAYGLEKLQYIGNNKKDLISNVINVDGFANTNTFTYPSVYGSGFDINYVYHPSFLKEELVIQDVSFLPTPKKNLGSDVELSLEFRLRANGDIKGNGVKWDKNSDIYVPETAIFDNNDNEVIVLPQPYAYDSDGVTIPLEYSLKASGINLFVSIETPYEWLIDPARKYPVYIDPTTQIEENNSDVYINLSNNEYSPLESIYLHNVSGDGNLIIDTNITTNHTSINNIVYAYAIDPTELSFDYGDASVRNTTGDILLKCLDWNVQTDTCGSCVNETDRNGIINECSDNETWIYQDDISRSSDYDFSFDSQDPAYAEYIISDGESTTTGNTFVNKLTDTFNVPESGNHLILVRGEITGSSTNDLVYAQATLDNVQFMNHVHEPKDATNSEDYANFFGMTMQNISSGSHSVEVNYKGLTSGVTTYIRNVRSNVFSLDEVEYAQRLPFVIVSATDTTYLNLTFTPNATQEYLILATGSLGDTESNSQTIYSSFVVDGSSVDEFQFEPKDYYDNMTFAFPYVANLTNGVSYNFSINAYHESGDATWNRIKDMRIVAIPMDEYWDLHYSQSLAQSDNNGVTRLNKTSLTFTPTYAGNYTFIATAQIYTATRGQSGDVYFNFNGSDVCEMHKEQKELGINDDGDWHQLLCMYQSNLDESSYTSTIQWAEGDSSTTTIRNAKIIAFSTEDNTPTTDTCSYTGSGNWNFFADIYCYITQSTTDFFNNIIMRSSNTTVFANNVSNFNNMSISNLSTMRISNSSTVVLST